MAAKISCCGYRLCSYRGCRPHRTWMFWMYELAQTSHTQWWITISRHMANHIKRPCLIVAVDSNSCSVLGVPHEEPGPESMRSMHCFLFSEAACRTAQPLRWSWFVTISCHQAWPTSQPQDAERQKAKHFPMTLRIRAGKWRFLMIGNPMFDEIVICWKSVLFSDLEVAGKEHIPTWSPLFCLSL